MLLEKSSRKQPNALGKELFWQKMLLEKSWPAASHIMFVVDS